MFEATKIIDLATHAVAKCFVSGTIRVCELSKVGLLETVVFRGSKYECEIDAMIREIDAFAF